MFSSIAQYGRDLPTGPKLPGHSPLGNSKGGLRAQRGKVRLGSVPISSVPGSSLDLVRLLAFPSEDRIDRLQRLIRRVLKSPASPARLWRSLFGHLASMIQLVPGARRHIRPLQYFVQERWDMSMPESTPVFLTPAARETLQW